MKRQITLWGLLAGFAFLWSCNSGESTDVVETTETTQVPVDASARAADPYLDSLTSWIFEHPTDTKALNLRAIEYLNKKNIKYALADAQTALSLDSTNAQYWDTWAEVNMVFNKTRISRDSWLRCIELDPQSIDCRLSLAKLYTTVGEYEDSEILLKEAMAINPNNEKIYMIQATNLLSLQADTVNAIRMAQKAIDINPDFWEAIDMVAVLYASQKDPLAVSYYKRLIEIDSTRADIYYKLGFYYMKNQEWNESIEAYLEATKYNPADPEPFFSLGYVHMQLGDYRNAIEYFSRAINVQEINHRAYYGRGYAYQKLGDVTKAEADYRKALEYNPQHKPSSQALQNLQSYN
ncbi:MAG: hypothetical protein SchgKO_08450 [Schleiferiaceae bacterium]